MIGTIVTIILLLHNFGYLTISNAHLYSVKRCYHELEKSRKFLQQIKHELLIDEYKRQMQHIQALLFKQNSIALFNFTITKYHPSICSASDSSSNNDDNDNNNYYNSNDGMVPLISWIDEMHNYLSNSRETCEGPEFHNITTVTMPQLRSFFSLFVINHGLPLCSICDRMLSRVKSILFSTNSVGFTHTEQILYQFFLTHIPAVETICSGLIPDCYHYYKINALSITPAAKCAQCNICMATTTYVENRILLNQAVMDYIHNWIEFYLHKICLGANRLFPSKFYWDGINYTHCRTWTHKFVVSLINRLTENILPEMFCSVTLKWCKPYEIPSIIDCLEEFCDESFPEEWKPTICGLTRNNSVNSAAFPEQQNVNR
uniref:Saposin B-type domain-containing protein n=2 Tax=Wuchereria bancrofti TaxID=6293 RepID=A0AAF5PZU0_WUCBA